MKSSILFFALIFCTSPGYAKSEDAFGDKVQNCIAIVKPADLKCSAGPSCPPKSVTAKVEACLAKMGVAGTIRYGASDPLDFIVSSAEKIFPQSKGCLLIVSTSKNDRFRSQLMKQEKSSSPCFVDGYELADQAAVSVSFAQAQKDGSWKIPRSVIGVGLDSLMGPNRISVLSTVDSDTEAPWLHFGAEANCETEDPFEYANDERSYNLEHYFGLEKKQWPMAGRHYVGRNGPKHFNIVTAFELKSALKICGIEIPKGTKLSTSFAPAACSAATDGAIDIQNIPADLFPKLKRTADEKTDVYCAPKAQKASQGVNGGDAYKTPPKLDWQDCDCGLNIITRVESK